MHEAVILAGGFGTRLQPVIKDMPKSMALVDGRPFLEYLLDYLKSFGYERVVLSVGYRHQTIMDHFGTSYHGLELIYAIENKPLGTGGGIRLAIEKCVGENVLTLNGDTLFLVDLTDFMNRHQEKSAAISIALRKVTDISRYGAVRVNENSLITVFGEKIPEKTSGLINGGIYLIHREFYLENTKPGAFSMEKDIFEKWVSYAALAGFVYDAYFLDIGIPEDYEKAQHEFKSLTY